MSAHQICEFVAPQIPLCVCAQVDPVLLQHIAAFSFGCGVYWFPAAHVFLMESCGADIMSAIFDCTYSNNLDQGFVGVETGRGLQGWGNLLQCVLLFYQKSVICQVDIL